MIPNVFFAETEAVYDVVLQSPQDDGKIFVNLNILVRIDNSKVIKEDKDTMHHIIFITDAICNTNHCIARVLH